MLPGQLSATGAAERAGLLTTGLARLLWAQTSHGAGPGPARLQAGSFRAALKSEDPGPSDSMSLNMQPLAGN